MGGLSARGKAQRLEQPLNLSLAMLEPLVQLDVLDLQLPLQSRDLLTMVCLEHVELPDAELELLLLLLSCLLPPLSLEIGLDFGLEQLALALLLGLRLLSEPGLQELQLGLHASCPGEEGRVLIRERIRLIFSHRGALLLEFAILARQLVVLQPELLLAPILIGELLLHALILPAFDLDEARLPVLVPFIVQLVQLLGEVGDQVVLHVQLANPVPDHREVLIKDPDDDLGIVLLELLGQVVELDGHLGELTSSIFPGAYVRQAFHLRLPSLQPQGVELLLSLLCVIGHIQPLPLGDLIFPHRHLHGLLLLSLPLSLCATGLDIGLSPFLALPVVSLLFIVLGPPAWGPLRSLEPLLVSLFPSLFLQHLTLIQRSAEIGGDHHVKRKLLV